MDNAPSSRTPRHLRKHATRAIAFVMNSDDSYPSAATPPQELFGEQFSNHLPRTQEALQ
ncbi:hypothetical protein [Halomonas citrativorans]|uniref:Uncharacterized protein n=1 Tax=Halomonas citrativorans TaxID=2742612 RepID=A0ABR9FDF4_9GAMM|nr:hypothetical protein [Halomonas citrativorans]MBE0404089.1 hypothetical protein [Halomonas citrativorans]